MWVLLCAQAQANVVPLSRKSLQAGAAAAQAPKTADQEAMQAQVKSDALQRDTLKASELAAEVSPQASKPVVLLIHGGAQGGWVWSYPTLVGYPSQRPQIMQQFFSEYTIRQAYDVLYV